MTQWIVAFRVAAAAFMLAAAALTVGKVMAQTYDVEQPSYDIVDAVGPIEIRHYGPRLAAEADMGSGGSVERGQQSAFMALADFIFAKNRQGPEVAMTAPVAIEQAEAPIAMTAPVAIEPGEGGQVMRFFMPAAYTMETLPKPGDPRVRIVTVPAQTLAVLRFSGEADDTQVAERKTALMAALQDSAWQPVDVPGLFAYDPPMTPPERRRNEVFVAVEPVAPAGSVEQPHGNP
jgi:hypothetical protein